MKKSFRIQQRGVDNVGQINIHKTEGPSFKIHKTKSQKF